MPRVCPGRDPLERLLAAQTELKAEVFADPDPRRWGAAVMTSTLPSQPVVDGEVVPDLPITRITEDAGARVDLVVGSNTEDWRLSLALNGAIGQITYPSASPGDLLAAVQTGGSASRRSAWPRPTRGPHQVRTCTSLPGPHRD